MEGKSRFTPRQINKALRLLRDLPVKDGRKSIQETLRLLEHGMRDALEKGYSREDIQHKIAEAEVIISATTLKSFLGKEQKNAGQKLDEAAARETKNSGRLHAVETAGKTKKSDRKNEEAMTGADEAARRSEPPAHNAAENVSPGSIFIKPDTPKEDL